MKSFRTIGLVIIALMIFAAGIGAGVFLDKQNNRPNPDTVTVQPGTGADFQMINQAWGIIKSNYVDQSAVKPLNLTYGAISGMVDSLGDTGHSTFLSPKEVQQANDSNQGQLQGVGLQVQAKNGAIVVVAPIEGSPAQQAKIVAGDIILEVDGKAVTNVVDAVSAIRGTAGTSVTLTILDSAGNTRTVPLVRAVINLINVTWNMLPGTKTAHLRLATFAANVTGELDTALSEIRAQGATGIILDLRNNPGGLLDQAVGVTSRFINKGNVIMEKDINGKMTSIPVTRGQNQTTLPMVILVNQGTASAAEIVVGALSDAGRAKSLGETTFGTGTVLVQFPLSDGSALVLAIQEWLTPSGKTIWHTGLTPDTVVTLPNGIIPLFPQTEKAANAGKGMTQADIQTSGDQQLLDAMKALP